LRGSKVAQRTTPYIFLRILKLDKIRILIEKQIKGLLYTECFSTSPIMPSFKLERSVIAMLKEKYFKNLVLHPRPKGESFI